MSGLNNHVMSPSPLYYSPSDTPEQVAQKLRLVDIYNRRLDERERRKAFVLERGLLNVRKQQAADRRRSAAERELQVRCLVSGSFRRLSCRRGMVSSGFGAVLCCGVVGAAASNFSRDAQIVNGQPAAVHCTAGSDCWVRFVAYWCFQCAVGCAKSFTPPAAHLPIYFLPLLF